MLRFENLFFNISIDLLYNTLRDIFITFEIETELNIDREFFMTLCLFVFIIIILFLMEIFLNRFVGLEWAPITLVMLQISFFFTMNINYTVKVNKSLKVFRYIDDVLVINADIIDILSFLFILPV